MYNILIIDDEAMITETLATLIEMMLDYNVYTYNDPSELIQSDFLEKTRVDMVISDFMMPKQNGIETLKHIKDVQPDVVPILLTGYADKENAIKSINEVGLYYYMEKPWDNNQLIKVVQNGLEKKTLEDEVKEKVVIIEKRNDEINRLYRLMKKDYHSEMSNSVDVVVSLANIVEAKDEYTDGHTGRVSKLCTYIGDAMGLSEESLQILHTSGIIHDVGKVGIPEDILNKPGKLTEAEFERMKTHSEVGYRIVRPLKALEKCMQPIRNHHEKLDGTGYPDGLKGDEIDVETRILAVVDIFDALYTERPYKKALPLATCLAILDEEVQKEHIDPTAVKTLKQLAEQGRLGEIYK